MRRITEISICAFLGLALVGPAAADKTSKREKHRTIHISYGVVLEIDEVKLKSDAAKGAAVGGLVGLAAAHDESGKNKRATAAAGAALGALLTRAAEGKHKANGYTVRLTDGSTIKVIMDDADIRVGDCVAVEEGSTSNVRHVDDELCGESGLDADAEVRETHDDHADACHAAKESLLAAETEEQVDLAMQKVKVLCH